MVERTEYLEKIKTWREEQVIKVVTGIRRCGKSTLLQQYRDYLLSTGVSSEQIIFINFEELEYEEIAKELDLELNTVRTRIRRGKQHLAKMMLRGEVV